MKDPFLEDCGGWTPAPDVLTRNSNYGFEGAYLWGRIRRLCQIGKGSYTISHGELGKRIGMSRRTVIKYLDRLIEDGYTEDLTPGVRNKAHTYSTKKGEAKILSGMQISHTESDMALEDTEVIEPEGIDVGMRNLHSDDAEIAHLDPSGMQNLHTDYAEIAQQGMQNLHLKRESLETLKETKKKEKTPPKGGGKPPAANEPESRAMFSALAETCGLDIKLLTGENRGALNQAEKIMRDNGYKPADLSAFSDWWHAHDWRGKQGDDPSLPQIRETWGRFRKWQQGNIPANADPILPPLPPLSADEAVWAEAMTIIQGSVTHATFDQLIRPLKPAGDSNGTFILLSPAELDPRLLKKIEPALIQVDHNIKKVEVHQNDTQTSHQIGPPNHHP